MSGNANSVYLTTRQLALAVVGKIRSQEAFMPKSKDTKGRNPSANPQENLNLYLAFLEREARLVRAWLGYETEVGVLTPVRAEVNRLYSNTATPTLDLCARAYSSVERLGGKNA